jgi:hypothetical protein
MATERDDPGPSWRATRSKAFPDVRSVFLRVLFNPAGTYDGLNNGIYVLPLDLFFSQRWHETPAPGLIVVKYPPRSGRMMSRNGKEVLAIYTYNACKKVGVQCWGYVG